MLLSTSMRKDHFLAVEGSKCLVTPSDAKNKGLLSHIEHLYYLLQSSESIMENVTERMEEAGDGQERCETTFRT